VGVGCFFVLCCCLLTMAQLTFFWGKKN